ncbi:hypothetical protein GA0004736_3127 [Curtobacterium sp. 9128]|uniref:hypothetical protein n=1 Tax=Curtobacterium sp. 9128 TaxID=1793722 RepID=UPI0007D72269|nr:hypothetical protein [Curtobacterium sp. 9128]SBN64169.1 hypothetical protein GA0004736_3127 [Curtobacterium sp. 9128]
MLRPVTGTVQTLTDARPVTTVVSTLDHVVGAVPIVGTLLGDDTLGTVTAPVSGLVDDTLGGVGTAVGTVPDVLPGTPGTGGGTLPGGSVPHPQIPSPPAGDGVPALGGSSTSVGEPSGQVALRAAAAPEAVVAQATPAADDVTVLAPAASSGEQDAPASATIGGGALFVPDGHGHQDSPLGGSGSGLAGSTTTVGSAGAGVVGTVAADADQDPLAAGTRGTIADDAVPASLTGDHDVAPD